MWRRMPKATSGLAALLVVGMAGCVDLNVQNPNAPDASRALATAGDVESLIAGAYTRWLYALSYDGPAMMWSVASGEHVAPWANAGMEYYGRIPRVPTANNPGHPDVGQLTTAWTQSYRVIAAIRDGLQKIDSGKVTLADAAATLRARAYAKYMQGIAHGTLALLYDSAFVYDETIDPKNVQLQDYKTVMTAALGYLDQAITLAGSGSFTIPDTWMSQSVTSATLVQLAHSYKARFRAAVARTPTERQAVDWTKVAADANAGVTSDWEITFDCLPGRNVFCGGDENAAIIYIMFSGWQMQNNWVAGMADQSGHYQAWVNTPLLSKQPFMIFTPDSRWPQGGNAALPDSTNERLQLASPGDFYGMNSGDSRIWNRPDRGTWRWSYYEQRTEPYFTAGNLEEGTIPEVTVEEMQALVAEAAYRAGNLATVVSFVNQTRTQHGLQATNAAGLNVDCVPKLPNGTCGDLWEMFKWEKRLEVQFAGLLRSGWYYDSRGWGDLMQGTILQIPVPYREMQILLRSPYDYGGVAGTFGAPVGTYGY